MQKKGLSLEINSEESVGDIRHELEMSAGPLRVGIQRAGLSLVNRWRKQSEFLDMSSTYFGDR